MQRLLKEYHQKGNQEHNYQNHGGGKGIAGHIPVSYTHLDVYKRQAALSVILTNKRISHISVLYYICLLLSGSLSIRFKCPAAAAVETAEQLIIFQTQYLDAHNQGVPESRRA